MNSTYMARVLTACVAGEKFSLASCQLQMSAAANLHLLLLAYQRVEHEDEGEEVEVDGQADLEEHVGDRFSSGGQQCSTTGSCLNCVSVCRSDTRVTLTTFWGDWARAVPLIGENQMD